MEPCTLFLGVPSKQIFLRRESQSLLQQEEFLDKLSDKLETPILDLKEFDYAMNC